MYSFIEIMGSIKFTIYFFGSFSGHIHPFTPVNPLEFDEIHGSIKKHGRAVYYQGWYSEAKEGSRLDRLLKYRLIGQPFNTKFKSADLGGVYYHRLENAGSEWVVKESITPELVLKQKHYLRYVVNNEGELESAYHIYSSPMFKLEYTYSQAGLLINVDDIAYETTDIIPDL